MNHFTNQLTSQTQQSPIIDKSPNDNNIYKYLKLENELEVVLVSNPNSNQYSAVTLTVGVGSLYDPPDVLGLSHLVERTLLLSNDKNPDSNDDFSTFIQINGGLLNSVTYEDKTSFYYKIDSTCLEESIERFSSYIVAPAFKKELIDREINFIESEFNSGIEENKKNMVLLKGLFENDHPYGQFSCGNFKTLAVQDIRSRVIEFYDKWYSTNVMKLCVFGKQSIDKLEEITRKYLGQIKNKKVFTTPPITKFKLKQPIKFEIASNVQDRYSLKILWPVNEESLSFKRNVKSSSSSIITYYLGHECKGSLSAALLELDYAHRLYSFSQSYTIRDLNIIGLEIYLTKNGFDNIDHVIFLVQQTVREFNANQMVKSELKCLDVEWKYLNNDQSLDLTRVVSNNLFFVDYPSQVLRYPKYLFEKENPNEISKILSYMVPTNMVVMVSSCELKSSATNQFNECYGGINYNTEIIDDTLIKKWKSQFTRSTDIYLPKENPYIPSNEVEIKNKSSSKPHEIYNFNGIKVDWGCESSLNSPYLNVIIKFDSPSLPSINKSSSSSSSSSPSKSTTPVSTTNDNSMYKSDVLFYILKKCLKECLYQDILYYLELLKYYIKMKDLTLFTYGFGDKLLVAIEEIFKFFYAFDISESKFKKIKDKIEKNYESKLYKDPSLSSKIEIISYIKMNSSLVQDRMEYFKNVTRDSFVQEIKRFFKKVNYKIFMFGNIKKEEAVQFGKRLNTIVNRISIPTMTSAKNDPSNETYSLPRYEFHIRKNSKDPNLSSYYTNILWQIDEKISKKLISIVHILVLLLNNRLYHELRNVQQFAHHIECTPIKINNRIYISLFIQSNVKSPDFIIEYVKNYLSSQFTYYFLNSFNNDYFKSSHKIFSFLNGNQEQHQFQQQQYQQQQQQQYQSNGASTLLSSPSPLSLSSTSNTTTSSSSSSTPNSTPITPVQQNTITPVINNSNNGYSISTSIHCLQQPEHYNGRINQNQNQIALNYWDNYNVFGCYQYYEKILKTIKKLNFNQIKKVYLKYIYPPSKETCLFIYHQYPKSVQLDNFNNNLNNNNNNEKIKLITNDYNSFKLSFIQLSNS